MDQKKHHTPWVVFRRFRPVIMLCSLFIALSPIGALMAEPTVKTITVNFKEAPLSVVFSALFAHTDKTLTVDSSLDQRLTGNFDGSVNDVVAQISEALSIQATVTPSRVTVMPKKQEPPRVVTQLASTSTNPLTVTTSTNQRTTVERIPYDRLVERLFVLDNAFADDRLLGDAQRTVIPGVATQLKQLVTSLGLNEFQFRSGGMTVRSGSSSIVALPSMNAVLVKDLESKMALYGDLIESIDTSFVSSSFRSASDNNAVPGLSWVAVQ